MDLSGAGQTRAAVLPGLAAAGYAPHPALHGPQAVWGEKNCYVDLWIELLHTLGAEPLALWPFALEIDFEGDQWTFFKPPTTALRRLYGIDVQELTPWRPLAAQAIEHLAAGRWLSIEADAYWLPDVAGTDYRRHHAKTTIVLNDVDLQARRLGYFHNAGYFALDGEDFARLFHLADTDGAAEPARLPLFAEFIRIDRRVVRPAPALRTLARAHLHEHLAWRPQSNPVRRFAARIEADLPYLRAQGLAHYHAWAFAGIRQLGAAFEFAALGLRWQAAADGAAGAGGGADDAALRAAAAAFDEIAVTAKTLILKMARAVMSPRPADLAPLMSAVAASWDRGMTALTQVPPPPQ